MNHREMAREAKCREDASKEPEDTIDNNRRKKVAEGHCKSSERAEELLRRVAEGAFEVT